MPLPALVVGHFGLVLRPGGVSGSASEEDEEEVEDDEDARADGGLEAVRRYLLSKRSANLSVKASASSPVIVFSWRNSATQPIT